MIYPNGKWGYIYEIKCNKTNKRYVGHTFKTLTIRLSNHKSKCNSCKSKEVMSNNDYKIKLLREWFVYSKVQLKYYETKCIKLYKKLYGNLCVNQMDLYENKADDYRINRETKLVKVKDHYEKNRERYCKVRMDRYYKNKETICELKRDKYKKDKYMINQKSLFKKYFY